MAHTWQVVAWNETGTRSGPSLARRFLVRLGRGQAISTQGNKLSVARLKKAIVIVYFESSGERRCLTQERVARRSRAKKRPARDTNVISCSLNTES